MLLSISLNFQLQKISVDWERGCLQSLALFASSSTSSQIPSAAQARMQRSNQAQNCEDDWCREAHEQLLVDFHASKPTVNRLDTAEPCTFPNPSLAVTLNDANVIKSVLNHSTINIDVGEHASIVWRSSPGRDDACEKGCNSDRELEPFFDGIEDESSDNNFL